MEFEGFRREPVTVSLSALVDVVFILVIFVVLAASFDRIRGLDIDLPEGEGEPAESARMLTVTVPKTGPILIEGEAVTEEALEDRLRELRGAHDDVVLFADGAVALKRAVAVLSSARAAGFSRLAIAAESPATAPSEASPAIEP